jgi:SSS family solute:Na+ symporter
MGFAALGGAVVQEGLLIFWALLTYQGMIMLFPVVLLGLYWRRANKEGALIGFIAGTVVAMGLYLTKPAFIAELGWSEGVYGLFVSLALMLVFGYLKPEAEHVQGMWEDIEEARRTKKVEKVTDSTLEY